MEDCRNFAVNFKRSVSKIQRNSLTLLPYEILKIMIILEETKRNCDEILQERAKATEKRNRRRKIVEKQ